MERDARQRRTRAKTKSKSRSRLGGREAPSPRRLLLPGHRERLLGLLHGIDGRLDLDVEVLVGAETRPCRDEAAHDDVLLQTAELVDLAADGSLGQHLRRLLERG